MYIDFHNHMDFYEGDKLNEAIREIDKNNIKVISCAMDEKSYKDNLQLGKMTENIIATFGIHPSKVLNINYDLDKFDEYIKESKLIGEVGLDFYWVEDKSNYNKQVEIFRYFLRKAKEYNKYLNIHTKGAEDLIYKLIGEHDVSEQSIIHWYSGDINTLNKLIDAKCYFTMSVDLNYSELSKEILNQIPIKRLLAETDGPTALEWVNGKYGMPSEIINVYKNISELKHIDINELIENSNKLYNEIINK